jgi:cysteine-rich repeat protein
MTTISWSLDAEIGRNEPRIARQLARGIRGLVAVLALALCWLQSTAVGAAPLLTGLGGDAGYGERGLPPANDTSIDVDLSAEFPDGINFYGDNYTRVYINSKGSVSFGAGHTGTPSATLPISPEPMIAGWWTNLDSRDPPLMGPAPASGANRIWYDAIPGRFVVTWNQVGYFPRDRRSTVSFQIIITDKTGVPGRADGDVDVELRYASIALPAGVTEVNAGFDAGDSTLFVALPGNFSMDITDVATTSNYDALPDNQGRWIYALTGGVAPDCGDNVLASNEQCDDGNHTNGDLCDEFCRLECPGDANVDHDDHCDLDPLDLCLGNDAYPDPDLDHKCNDVDTDDDGDGVLDTIDTDPNDNTSCQDFDHDNCDDCVNVHTGGGDRDHDGADLDGDGKCDDGLLDLDLDGDGVDDDIDSDASDDTLCADIDNDGCDDCAISGPLHNGADPDHDGDDADSDGLCDTGDDCPDDAANDADHDTVCEPDDICVGDDATGDDDMDGLCNDRDSERYLIEVVAVADNCPEGGITVYAGPDGDGDDVLDIPDEVTSEEEVCNGTSGDTGMRGAKGPQGAQGPQGPPGDPGPQGEDGQNGMSVLVRQDKLDAATEACPNGGVELETGVDDNGDGVLGDAEVDQNQAVCNGPAGASPAFNFLPIATDGACGAYTGVQVQFGLDDGDQGGIANNGVLETGEIDSDAVLCVAQADLTVEGGSGGCTVSTGSSSSSFLSYMTGAALWLLRRRRSRA